MTPKELKKLAAACRSAGISQFKNNEVEFTLTDLPPSRPRRRSSKEQNKEVAAYNKQAEIFESDTLSDEQLLFYSSGLVFDDKNGGN